MPNHLHVVHKTPQPNLSRGSGNDTHYAADPNRSGNNLMSTRGRVGDAVAGVKISAKKNRAFILPLALARVIPAGLDVPW